MILFQPFTGRGGVLARASLLLSLVLLLSPVLHAQEDQRGDVTYRTRQLTDRFYAEGASIADINGDGRMDVVSGPFWYERPSLERHAYYRQDPFKIRGYSNNFLTFTHDVTGDGHVDVLVVGFPGKSARLYVNPGPEKRDQTWPMHEVFNSVDNESPTLTDINGDGRPDLVCQNQKRFGYATYDPDNPTVNWTFHAISGKVAGGRFSHGLGVGDVNGDGRMDLLEKKGWWEQPAPEDGKETWTRHKYRFAEKGGAQMFAYDVNGDGRNDVITSLHAHGYGFAWFENIEKKGQITFEKHMIMPETSGHGKDFVSFSQHHAIQIADVDGDGLKDIVTGKRYWAHKGKDPGADEPAVLYWFELRRTGDGVQFVPHRIHGDSGVGTQFDVGDLNGDNRPDVVVGNKKGAFIHLQENSP